jgi:hypothetical protein
VKFVIVLKGKLSLAFTSKYCLFTVHGCNGESVKKIWNSREPNNRTSTPPARKELPGK